MRRSVYLLLVATLSVSSCYKEKEAEVSPDPAMPTGKGLVIMAEGTPMSKTDIDQGVSYWEYGDSISVIYDGQVYIYRTLQTGEQVTFTCENGIEDYDESKGIIAYYPPVAADGLVSLASEKEISFVGDQQVNAAKAPLVGVAAEEVSPDGSLRMSFSNICSVIEFRIDAGDVAEGIRTFKVEPASETGFDGYLSFTGTVDPETLAITPATTGNSITLTLPNGANLNRPLTLKVPVGRFTSPSGLKLTVESTFGMSDSRVVYATGIQSYSVENGIYSVKHFAKPLYPFSLLAMVDLGLSVKWATCNLGASSPVEYGDYYAWGETEPKSYYDYTNYKWCDGSETTLTKYNTDSFCGIVDNITRLGPEDDAVYKKLGGAWRMPTEEEYVELITECEWTWTQKNGVNGRLITAPNGNSIFLPAAGNMVFADLYNASSFGHYWSSSLISGESFSASYLDFSSDDLPIGMGSGSRCEGRTIRPVYDDRIHPESVSLNKSTLPLAVGATEQLSATVLPSDATDKTVTWSSDDTGVATVDDDGNVTAVAVGSATITATTNDGNLTATCAVTVKDIPSGAVDLGLSVLWGTCNLGTTTVGEKGEAYIWQGWTTALGKLGANWRMPTIDEFVELRSNCNWERFSINGVNGIKGTSLVVGYTDKWIFLPDGDYWSSSPGISSNSYQGITVSNSTTGSYIAMLTTDGGNYYLRVRPVYVYGKISVSSISVNPTTLTLNVGSSSTLTASIQPSNVTNNTVTWSSSNTSVATVSSSGKVTAVTKGTATITAKANDGSGKSATCSVTVKQPVTGITLNKTSLTLKVGGNETLTATVSPSTANDRSVTWTSSNTSVATVSSAGKVTGVAKGTATITVKAKDGSGKSANCSVTVSKSGIKAVDLGLSSGVKWAACNVNADSPEANGSYYAWAETSPKSDYSYDKYKWLSFDLYSDETVYSKYRVVSTSFGTGTLAPDGKKTLELDDDAARAIMEDNWRMPTKAEMEELINSCTWTWTTVNNVKGYKVASKKAAIPTISSCLLSGTSQEQA